MDRLRSASISVAMTKCPDGSNSGQKGFNLSHSSSVKSMTAGNSRQQEPGQLFTPMGKSSEKWAHIHTSCSASFLYAYTVQGPKTGNGAGSSHVS